MSEALTREQAEEPGGMMAADPHFERDVTIERIWQNASGVCLGTDCGRTFISRERFDTQIKPLIIENAALRQQLAEAQARIAKIEGGAHEA